MRYFSCLVFTLFCFAILFAFPSNSAANSSKIKLSKKLAFADKTKERQAIEDEVISDYKLLNEELRLGGSARQSKFTQRATAFHRTAVRMYQWLGYYFTTEDSRNSGEYVFESFVFALVVDYSANYWAARIWYNECAERLDKVAKAGQYVPLYRNQSISRLLAQRFAALNENLRNVEKPDNFNFSILKSNPTYNEYLAELTTNPEYESLVKDYSFEYSIIKLNAEQEADKTGPRDTTVWNEAFIKNLMQSAGIDAKTLVDGNVLVTTFGEPSVVSLAYADSLETTRKNITETYLKNLSSNKIFRIFLNLGGKNKEADNRFLSGVFFQKSNENVRTNCSKDGTFAIFSFPGDTIRLKTGNGINLEFARCFLSNQVTEKPPKWLAGIMMLYISDPQDDLTDDPTVKIVKQAAKDKKLYDLSDLFKDDMELRSVEKFNFFMTEARFVCLFFKQRNKTKNELQEIFQMMQKTKMKSADVVKQVTGKNIDELNEEFLQYISGLPDN